MIPSLATGGLHCTLVLALIYACSPVDHLGNSFGGCGAWRQGKWVPLFSGHKDDPAFRAANVRWIQRFYAGLQDIHTPREGARLLLTPNFDISGSWDDPTILAVGNATDGVLSECSFTGCAQRLVTGSQWVATVRFANNLQAGGKAYVGNEYCKLQRYRSHLSSSF